MAIEEATVWQEEPTAWQEEVEQAQEEAAPVSQVKVLMRVIGNETTPHTVGFDQVNKEIESLLDSGWQIYNSQFLPSGPMNFRLCLLLVRS